MASIVNLFRARTSEKDRFEALLRPHIEILYRMAFRWTRCQSDAEDLVQELLTRMASRVAEMEQIEKLRPWLLRILYNRFVDDYRRQCISPIDTSHRGWQPDADAVEAGSDVIASAVDPHSHIEQEDLRQALHQALAQLEPEQRDLVLLHDVEGYTAEEAAEILAVPLGTVKSRLHRARARLRLLLFDASG